MLWCFLWAMDVGLGWGGGQETTSKLIYHPHPNPPPAPTRGVPFLRGAGSSPVKGEGTFEMVT